MMASERTTRPRFQCRSEAERRKSIDGGGCWLVADLQSRMLLDSAYPRTAIILRLHLEPGINPEVVMSKHAKSITLQCNSDETLNFSTDIDEPYILDLSV